MNITEILNQFFSVMMNDLGEPYNIPRLQQQTNILVDNEQQKFELERAMIGSGLVDFENPMKSNPFQVLRLTRQGAIELSKHGSYKDYLKATTPKAFTPMETKHYKILCFLEHEGRPIRKDDFPNEISSDFSRGIQKGSLLHELQIELKNKDWVHNNNYSDTQYWITPDGQDALKREIQRRHHMETSNNNHTTYNVQQAAAVGTNATAFNNTFNQLNNPVPDNVNFELLASELSTLRQALLNKASSPEHYAAIGDVSKAELAIKDKDRSKIATSLLSAGKWVLTTATEIGTSVVAEIIKKSLLENQNGG